jgi:endonuclease/exonuclease/phosphatase family metal-dependent hydrolase
VLTWNLFHGRSVPPAGRPLLHPFRRLIAHWDWDVALLQEVPPWWPPLLAEAAAAQWRLALTSRNACMPLRRALASRSPDLIKSNGGGCNAVLARRGILEQTQVRLRVLPERRVAQLLRLEGGLCVVNYHASTKPALAQKELTRLAQIATEWAAGEALLFGGDLNLRHPSLPFEAVAHSTVDFLFAEGLAVVGQQSFPDRTLDLDGSHLKLSDHRPLTVRLAPKREGSVANDG